MRLKWKIGKFIAYILSKTLVGIRVVGQDNLLKDSGQILVSNHRSNMDPFFVGAVAGPEIYFMAKEELFHVSKFFSWLISFWNAIPLARDSRAAEALRKCSTILKDKKTVLIFPEGTRNKFEELLPFKPGFGYLAVNNRVPVVPVAISGVREAWNGRLANFIDRDLTKNGYGLLANGYKQRRVPLEIYGGGDCGMPSGKPSHIVRKFLTGRGITVRFGKPIDTTGFNKTRDDYEKLAKMVRNNIEQLLRMNEGKICH